MTMLMLTEAAGRSLFPESVMHTGWFAVLAAFVALNTVMYCALAVAKVLPRVYAGDFLTRRNRRAQTRSIYPDWYEHPPTLDAPAVDEPGPTGG
jgi:hypothetical protein